MWVSSVDAVLPLAGTVTKVRLGPGIGARVGEQLFGTFTYKTGITVSPKTCIKVVRAAPSTTATAPSSGSILARFLFVPCCHGRVLRNSGMAACAFSFFREGSPWLRTWASLLRLVFALLCGVTAAKCALMSGDVFVFIFFLAGPDPLSGHATRITISSTATRVCGSVP